jgi:hypothetical protein
MTENRPAAYGYGYGIDAYAYTPVGNYQYNWLRGGNFTAFSQSSSATNQDAITGILAQGYNQGTGTVSSAFGSYNQAFTNSTGDVGGAYGSVNYAFTNNSGNISTAMGSLSGAWNNSGSGTITNAYGAYNQSFINASQNISSAFGSYNRVIKNSNGSSSGTITNGYGTFSQVWNYHTNATGSIQNAFAYFAQVGGNAGTTAPITSYGYYGDMTGALGGSTRYGIYIVNETSNYFSGPLWAQSFNVNSDARLKKNIQPIANPIEKLKKISGYTYEWRTSEFDTLNLKTGKDYGIIAQEVEKIFPEMISTSPNGYKAVNYNNLVPVMIEAIKEQQKQIEKLTQEIETLKEKK